MSTIEPDDRFVSEEELSALLKKWQSPQPSAALDKRVTSSYLQEMSQASVMSDPVHLPKTDNEVVRVVCAAMVGPNRANQPDRRRHSTRPRWLQ